jgi:bifunctional non-homologous end joining protein LigD
MVRQYEFQSCIPTRGIKVPAGPDWIHEIKPDGYRLIVHRDGGRVRLFTRNGHDWTIRYPLIVEAALRNRQTSFVIDGEAVLLGLDGISDFNGLHSQRHDDEVMLYAFDILALDGDDLRKLPLHLRKTNLARLLAPRGDFRLRVRARRDRAGPVPSGMQHGPRGHGVQAPRPPLPTAQVGRTGSR